MPPETEHVSQCLNPTTKWARFQSGVQPVIGYCCIPFIAYALTSDSVSSDKLDAVVVLAIALSLRRGGEKAMALWASRQSALPNHYHNSDL